jgi:molybdopterin converting factor small subunit
LPTVLRSATGGQATVEADGATVGDVFDDLIRQHPGLKSQLLTDDGQLHRHLNVFLNDDDIRYLGKLDAKVGDRDTLTLMPAVAGGATPVEATPVDRATPVEATPVDRATPVEAALEAPA